MSRDFTPIQCPYCNAKPHGRSGLASHLRTHKDVHTEQHPLAPPTPEVLSPKSVLTSEVQPNADGMFPCPECGELLNTKAGLGNHRRQHGVKGASYGSVAHKAQRSSLNGLIVHQQRGIGNVPKRTSTRTSHFPQRDDYETEQLSFAITVGQLKEFCRRAAEEHGYPTLDFTRIVAELFHAEASR